MRYPLSVSPVCAVPCGQSVQVQCQDEGNNDSTERQEGQPGFEERHAADMFAVEEGEHAEIDHVPGCIVVIAHQVEGQGYVGVAIITAKVVRSAFVLL